MRGGTVLRDKGEHEIWACVNADVGSTDEVSQLKKAYPELERELYMESRQIYVPDAFPRPL